MKKIALVVIVCLCVVGIGLQQVMAGGDTLQREKEVTKIWIEELKIAALAGKMPGCEFGLGTERKIILRHREWCTPKNEELGMPGDNYEKDGAEFRLIYDRGELCSISSTYLAGKLNYHELRTILGEPDRLYAFTDGTGYMSYWIGQHLLSFLYGESGRAMIDRVTVLRCDG